MIKKGRGSSLLCCRWWYWHLERLGTYLGSSKPRENMGIEARTISISGWRWAHHILRSLVQSKMVKTKAIGYRVATCLFPSCYHALLFTEAGNIWRWKVEEMNQSVLLSVFLRFYPSPGLSFRKVSRLQGGKEVPELVPLTSQLVVPLLHCVLVPVQGLMPPAEYLHPTQEGKMASTRGAGINQKYPHASLLRGTWESS